MEESRILGIDGKPYCFFGKDIDPRILELQKLYGDQLYLQYNNMSRSVTWRRRIVWYKPWTWWSKRVTIPIEEG